MTVYPRALDAPAGDLVLINDEMIRRAVAASRESPRKRIILPFHKSPADTLHRMLNAIQAGSYVQPHRHLHPPKAESIIVLQGAIRYVAFNDSGDIKSSHKLSPGPDFGIDTKAGVFHTFFALAPDTVLFEVKPGPYDPASDKDFADWAPKEGSAESVNYLGKLHALGER
jgi:cupin fold WbuC family metalloprotein